MKKSLTLLLVIISLSSTLPLSRSQNTIIEETILEVDHVSFECEGSHVLQHNVYISQFSDHLNLDDPIFNDVAFSFSITNGNNRTINPKYFNYGILGQVFISSNTTNNDTASRIAHQLQSFFEVELFLLSNNSVEEGCFYSFIGAIPKDFGFIDHEINTSIYQEINVLYFDTLEHLFHLYRNPAPFHWETFLSYHPFIDHIKNLQEFPSVQSFDIGSLFSIDYAHEITPIQKDWGFQIPIHTHFIAQNSINILNGFSVYGSNIALKDHFNVSINEAMVEDLQYAAFIGGISYYEDIDDYKFHARMNHIHSKTYLELFPLRYKDVGTDELEDLLGFASPRGLFSIGSLFNLPETLYFNYTTILRQNSDLNILQHTENSTMLNITLENNGDNTVYGVELETLKKMGFYNQAPSHDLSEELEELGYNVESMFSQETPKLFILRNSKNEPIASIPELSEKSYIMYSQEYVDALLEHKAYLESKYSYNVEEYASHYNQSESLFNPKNWEILPNESVSILVEKNIIEYNETHVEWENTLLKKEDVYFETKVQYSSLQHSNLFYAQSNTIVEKFSNISITTTHENSNISVLVKNLGSEPIECEITFPRFSLIQSSFEVSDTSLHKNISVSPYSNSSYSIHHNSDITRTIPAFTLKINETALRSNTIFYYGTGEDKVVTSTFTQINKTRYTYSLHFPINYGTLSYSIYSKNPLHNQSTFQTNVSAFEIQYLNISPIHYAVIPPITLLPFGVYQIPQLLDVDPINVSLSRSLTYTTFSPTSDVVIVCIIHGTLKNFSIYDYQSNIIDGENVYSAYSINSTRTLAYSLSRTPYHETNVSECVITYTHFYVYIVNLESEIIDYYFPIYALIFSIVSFFSIIIIWRKKH